MPGPGHRSHSSSPATSRLPVPTEPPENEDHKDIEKGLRSPSDASPFCASVESLEDLTDRLVHAGIYDEYMQWCDGYARWSMGDSSGARSKQRSMSMLVCASSSGNGSSRVAESVSVENSVASFRPSSPKCRSFTFKRTLTYWTAVSFIEGSALFTAWYGFLSIQGAHTAYSDSLMLSPSTFGVAWFLIGSYLGYLHQMNWELGPKMGRCSTWYFAAPWKLPISRAMVCWQSYLAGTFMWIISEVTSFVNWDTVLEEQLFIYVPMGIGDMRAPKARKQQKVKSNDLVDFTHIYILWLWGGYIILFFCAWINDFFL
eukprot:GEMP01074799.1.p1 GENE.GEMP01074799.1~~GEMP01074799.1.p1  ORF type:complete len:315 (+),score=57.54 GEMP01074799.1:125-1069(+)